MNALLTWFMGICYLLEKPMSWGVPQVILAALLIFAAWRHRLVGLWILAAAAILSLASRVAFLIEMHMSDGKPSENSALIPELLTYSQQEHCGFTSEMRHVY